MLPRGGDSAAAQEHLKTVQKVQATDSAFAARLADGSVVAWGEDLHGGDVSAVQQQLQDVEGIVSSSWSFAAIPANGSVVTWGNPWHGGDSSGVQQQLRNVHAIQSTMGAIAAMFSDASVVTWGNAAFGGHSARCTISFDSIAECAGPVKSYARETPALHNVRYAIQMETKAQTNWRR